MIYTLYIIPVRSNLPKINLIKLISTDYFTD